MADLVEASVLSPTDRTMPVYSKKATHPRSRAALGAIVLLSIFLNFFQLGQNGYGNLYYAAGVRSMVDSWHNFFFVSLDPGGFVTVDKPPIGFWLQTLSAKIFGFTPFSLFFPQAVCGVLAVLLLYYLVKRHFGIVAGLVAALALAVSPISVVTNRNNTIDSTLALAMLLAAWAVIHAAETGKLRWLLLSAVFVGIGFNIKMAEAYLVLPALVLTYLLCAPRSIWVRILHALAFVVVAFALSISWLTVVDLTPAAQHPYVGSSKNDSEVSLAFGYNGLGRLHIGAGNGSGGRIARPVASSSTGNTPNFAQQLLDPFTGGAAGPFHLFTPTMGGQIGWLLPFALPGIVALVWQRRFDFRRDRQQLGLILWGMWLLTMTIFFSADASFHEYYLTVMAPGLSAMVGIGLVMMWQDYRRAGWRGWLLPIALVGTAAVQIYMLSPFPSWSWWMNPLIGFLTALAVFGLILLRLRPNFYLRSRAIRIAGAVAMVGMGALLIAPTTWSGYSVLRNTESSAPTAGPNARGANSGFVFAGGSGARNGFVGGLPVKTVQTNRALISYLEAHQGKTKFLVATTSSGLADPIILATNRPVMVLGGFGGTDPILTVSKLQELLQNNTIRFFLLSPPRTSAGQLDNVPERYRDLFEGGSNAGGISGLENPGASQRSVSGWVTQNCSVVPANAWHSSTNASGASAGSARLYDCATRY